METERFVSVKMGGKGILIINFLPNGILEFPSNMGFYPEICSWSVSNEEVLLKNRKNEIEQVLYFNQRNESVVELLLDNGSKYVNYLNISSEYDNNIMVVPKVKKNYDYLLGEEVIFINDIKQRNYFLQHELKIDSNIKFKEKIQLVIEIILKVRRDNQISISILIPEKELKLNNIEINSLINDKRLSLLGKRQEMLDTLFNIYHKI